MKKNKNLQTQPLWEGGSHSLRLSWGSPGAPIPLPTPGPEIGPVHRSLSDFCTVPEAQEPDAAKSQHGFAAPTGLPGSRVRAQRHQHQAPQCRLRHRSLHGVGPGEAPDTCGFGHFGGQPPLPMGPAGSRGFYLEWEGPVGKSGAQHALCGAAFLLPFPLCWHVWALVSREERESQAAGPLTLRDWGLPGQCWATPRNLAAGGAEVASAVPRPTPGWLDAPLASCCRDGHAGSQGVNRRWGAGGRVHCPREERTDPTLGEIDH